MMKRIAQAVRQGTPTDAIAMLKETSLASGMVMERIGGHVTNMIVSKLVEVGLRMNDVMHCVLDVRRKQKNKQNNVLNYTRFCRTVSFY